MRFWIREIAGTLLVLLGLYFCVIAIGMVTERPSAFFDAIHPTVIGVFVFRGGIHLLKVALAARVCTYGLQKNEAAPTAPALRPARAVAPGPDW